MPRKRVVILYKYIPQYRVEFFRLLNETCRKHEIDLEIIYGTPGKIDALKGHSAELEFATLVPNRIVCIANVELIWQPILSRLRNADLVIVEQANKLLVNYVLVAGQLLGLHRFAFWGHGRDIQAANPNSLSERIKRWLVCVPHWWFVYTEGTAEYIQAVGFPRDRMTVVYNAIDTKSLIDYRRKITPDEIAEARVRHGITSQNVCIYVGSMYSQKRIDFLLRACALIRSRIPDFHMIFIGAGPDDHLVKRFCTDHPWATYLGGVFDREKVKYFMMSKLFLMPGLVGLAILDAFALGAPLITTDVPVHSPEIEYLQNGRNGVIVTPGQSVDDYASTVIRLLDDDVARIKLVANCAEAAAVYTVENMVHCFFEGMIRALAMN
jgi:glycosyltransferase involved in cell wall biosynthesis